jgi:hypothetical protein
LGAEIPADWQCCLRSQKLTKVKDRHPQLSVSLAHPHQVVSHHPHLIQMEDNLVQQVEDLPDMVLEDSFQVLLFPPVWVPEDGGEGLNHGGMDLKAFLPARETVVLQLFNDEQPRGAYLSHL